MMCQDDRGVIIVGVIYFFGLLIGSLLANWGLLVSSIVWYFGHWIYCDYRYYTQRRNQEMKN